MSDLKRSSNQELQLNNLMELLQRYGYNLLGTYERPRGKVVQFSSDVGSLFVVLEGGVVVLDLILSLAENKCLRVSLNQALWYGGFRDVAKNKTVEAQIQLFVSAIPVCCHQLLVGNEQCLDRKFCFEMSSEECRKYLEYQTKE